MWQTNKMWQTSMISLSSIPSVPAVLLLVPVVPRRTASDAVNDHNENNSGCVAYQQSPPLAFDVGQKPCFARFAVEAQFVLVVGPCGAVTVRYSRSCLRNRPEGSVLELEPAVSRWFAAPGLIGNDGN